MGFLPFFPRRFFKLQSRKTKGFVFSSHGIQGFDVIKAIRRAKHHLAVPPTAEGKLEWILLIGLIENLAATGPVTNGNAYRVLADDVIDHVNHGVPVESVEDVGPMPGANRYTDNRFVIVNNYLGRGEHPGAIDGKRRSRPYLIGVRKIVASFPDASQIPIGSQEKA